MTIHPIFHSIKTKGGSRELSDLRWPGAIRQLHRGLGRAAVFAVWTLPNVPNAHPDDDGRVADLRRGPGNAGGGNYHIGTAVSQGTQAISQTSASLVRPKRSMVSGLTPRKRLVIKGINELKQTL